MKPKVGDKVQATDPRVEATYNKVGVIQRIEAPYKIAVVRFEGKDPVYGDFPFERVIPLKYLVRVS